MHMSDLIHFGLFLAYLGLLLMTAGNTRIKALRNFSSLIQLTVLLLCVDLLIGFFAIEQIYDNTQSARWISKSIYALPVMLVVSVFWLWRSHRKKRSSTG